MTIHAFISLSTIFFGIGYVYGNSKGFSITKLLVTVIVVAPLLYQFLTGFNSVTGSVIIVSLFIGFILPRLENISLPKFRFPQREKREKPPKFKAEKKAQARYSKAEREKERQTRAEEMERRRNQGSSQSNYEESAEEPTQEREKPAPKPPTPPVEKDTRTSEEILGLTSPFSVEELKKAWRTKSKSVHPDNWNNTPVSLRKEMEEEQKRVNGAYSLLLKRV